MPASPPIPARWTADHLARVALTPDTTAPLLRRDGLVRVLPGEDVWDLWPVQESGDGRPARAGDVELWMALSAAATGHPELRHGLARLRLLGRRGAAWFDLGPVFADGASPGSREWSGSAVLAEDGSVSVFYTAAGRRGEPRPSWGQRVMEARGRIAGAGDGVRLEAAGDHREIVRADGTTYLLADELDGAPGRIRAFRDPAWFRDPADGREHLLIAASVPSGDDGGFAGAVALATRAAGDEWTLGPPLLRAEGVTHELERPHVVVHDGRYHLFFSANAHTFTPPVQGPTGLFGFVAPRLHGPWQPLNGSGLVVANPPEQPTQAYAWLVLPDLRVVSFVDYLAPPGVDLRTAPADEARAAFGGTAAPELRVALSGTASAIVSDPVAR